MLSARMPMPVGKAVAKPQVAVGMAAVGTGPRTHKGSASTVVPTSGSAVQHGRPQGRSQPLIQMNSLHRPSVFFFGTSDEYDEAYTVVKVQAAMFGPITKWQRELERLSELHDTDDEQDLQYILQETAFLMLRNMEYCGYGQTAGKVFRDVDACEAKFNQVSMEERSKFREETYVNVGGRRRKAKPNFTTDGHGIDNWLCITFVVAVEGKVTLPKINSVMDMRRALTTLGGVTADSLMAFELLWTPQADGDFFSREELLLDFPTLAILS